MLNLDQFSIEDVVKELSFALANYMDGDKDHDIQSATGLDLEDCERIAKARKLAEEVLGW